MARPLRYEAAGAVYHVMARGDGGKPVFEDDKNRYGWVDLLEKACERFGWRVHAWVLCKILSARVNRQAAMSRQFSGGKFSSR